jgi:hypothetical protein
MSTSGMVYYSFDRIPFSKQFSQYVLIVDSETGQLDFQEGHECELYDDMIYRHYTFGNIDGMAKLRLALSPLLENENTGVAHLLRYENVRACNLTRM